MIPTDVTEELDIDIQITRKSKLYEEDATSSMGFNKRVFSTLMPNFGNVDNLL